MVALFPDARGRRGRRRRGGRGPAAGRRRLRAVLRRAAGAHARWRRAGARAARPGHGDAPSPSPCGRARAPSRRARAGGAHRPPFSFGVIGQLGFFPARPASTPWSSRVTWRPARSARTSSSSTRLPVRALVRRPLPRGHRRRAYHAGTCSSPRSPSWPWPARRRRHGAWTMHDLSLYLLDILENSVRAGATMIAVSVVADRAADRLVMTVEDDGPGLPVSPEQVTRPVLHDQGAQEDRPWTEPVPPGGRSRRRRAQRGPVRQPSAASRCASR